MGTHMHTATLGITAHVRGLSFREGILSLARMPQHTVFDKSSLPTYAYSLWVTRQQTCSLLPYGAEDPESQGWEASALHALLDQHRLRLGNRSAVKSLKVAPAARMHIEMSLLISRPCK